MNIRDFINQAKKFIDKAACVVASLSIGSLVSGGAWHALRKTAYAVPMALGLGVSYTVTHLFILYRTIKESADGHDTTDSVESRILSTHSLKRDVTLATTGVISAIDAGFSSYGKMILSLALLTDSPDDYEAIAVSAGILATVSCLAFYSAHGKGYYSWLLPTSISWIGRKIDEHHRACRIINTAIGAIYTIDFAVNDALMLSLFWFYLAIPVGILSYVVNFYNFYRTYERREEELLREQHIERESIERKDIEQSEESVSLIAAEQPVDAAQQATTCSQRLAVKILLTCIFLYALASGYSTFSNIHLWLENILNIENRALDYALGGVVASTTGLTVYNYLSGLRY